MSDASRLPGTRQWRPSTIGEGKFGEPNMRMVVMHQVLGLSMAGRAVLPGFPM